MSPNQTSKLEKKNFKNIFWMKKCHYIKSVVFYRHEVPVTSQPITIVHMDDDIVVVNKPASIPVSGL